MKTYKFNKIIIGERKGINIENGDFITDRLIQIEAKIITDISV